MSFTLNSFLPEPSFIQIIEDQINPFEYPESPGVYVMVSKNNEILYTGKSKNLRERITSHTNSHNAELKQAIRRGQIKEIKIFCCQTELDADILERYFIFGRIYCGKFNIQYKSKAPQEKIPFDDKQEILFLATKHNQKKEKEQTKAKQKEKLAIKQRETEVYWKVFSGEKLTLEEQGIFNALPPRSSAAKRKWNSKQRLNKLRENPELYNNFINNLPSWAKLLID